MMIDLYPHQLQAIERLKSGSILMGGVGSGKSRTSLAYFFVKECGGTLDPDSRTWKDMVTTPKDLYIITTARKRDTLEWMDECVPFMLSSDPDANAGHIKVSIDSWNNVGKYINVENAFFIFDEQRVVGYGAWVRAFLKIAKKNRWILLSATPGDTWTDYMPVFIANGFYKNKTDFVAQHVIYNQFSKYHQVDHYTGVRKLQQLRDDITVDMPFERDTTPHHEKITVPYDRKIYLNTLRKRWNPFTKEPIQDISGLCSVLRKITNGDLARFDVTRELCETKRRVIIFYNFDYELDILRNLGGEFPIGEWNGHRHDPIPTGDRWVYLVQYTAGAEGWNCVTTDTIIFYSQSYSYKAMVQAAGRTDRMNTPYKDLYYYHLVSSAPIDIAIERALKNKKNFNEQAFFKP